MPLLNRKRAYICILFDFCRAKQGQQKWILNPEELIAKWLRSNDFNYNYL